MKSKIVLIGLFLSILLAYVSCSTQKAEWKGTIEKEDGVTVIKNPKEPMSGADVFVLEEELSIGEKEGREEYMFSEVQSIAVDNEERIYILDFKGNNVKIFNKNGDFIKKFGRGGQGPGEFYLPMSMIVSQDEIVVQNFNSFSFFSPDGEFHRSLPMAKERLGPSSIDSEGNFVGLVIVREEDNPRYELKKFDRELNPLHSLGSSPLPNSRHDGFNPFFPVLRYSLINGNQVVCGYMKEYELRIFDAQGNPIKKISKEYVPLEVTQEDVEERLKGEELPASLKETMSVPKFHCPFRWIGADEEGRIFVMTWERAKDGQGYYYDVFDQEGKYIVKIPLRARPDVFKKGKLYAVEEDEEGYPHVKRFKITWNTAKGR